MLLCYHPFYANRDDTSNRGMVDNARAYLWKDKIWSSTSGEGSILQYIRESSLVLTDGKAE